MKQLKATCPKCGNIFATSSTALNVDGIFILSCPNCGASLKGKPKVPENTATTADQKLAADPTARWDKEPEFGTGTIPGFRVPREGTYLALSLACLFFVFFLLIGISFGVFLVLLGISIVAVKLKQGQFLGQTVKLSQNQFPEEYEAAKIASDRLSMKMPDVFIRMDPVINAFAIGFLGRKSVVLNSSTVESMTGDELISILGHEFSHIRCGHTNWIVISGSTEAIKIPIISGLMGFIFMLWSRRAEYTADRGALIASRNLGASVSALAKVAVGERLYGRLNISELIKGQGGKVDTDLVAKIAENMGSHPFIIKRLRELEKFHRSRLFRDVLNRGLVSDKDGAEVIRERIKEGIERIKNHPQTGQEREELREEMGRLRKELEELKAPRVKVGGY